MTSETCRFVYDPQGALQAVRVRAAGVAVMADHFTNKGTAFTPQERAALGIEGYLPTAVRTLDQQVSTKVAELDRHADDFERYLYLRALFDRNAVLAHAVVASDIERFMGVIYTPTVGLACQRYSAMFRRAHGLHFSPDNIDRAEAILRTCAYRDIQVAVVTDNQGILGIGDQGAGGIAISLGKLMLYTQGAGIAPWRCLPISLDVGTDNPALLSDPNYVGWRQRRLEGDAYADFVHRFAGAFHRVFPKALCQWEDFSKQNAFTIRDRYAGEMLSFNDDIQGTGAVTLAAVLTAMKAKGEPLTDQVFLVHGAGAGGIGIAEQIYVALRAEGLPEAAARARIFTLDSRGLVTTERRAEPYKRAFAQDPHALPWLNDPARDGALLPVVRHAKVTVLIGTSGQPGCFTREVVEAVAANTPRPVVLPLSNPTDSSEALPQDVIDWTHGGALVATGSPFPSVRSERGEARVGQCNNVFVFPGVGMGTLASGARAVLPSFFTAAAHAVSDAVAAEDVRDGVLMPPVTSLRDVSERVALAVAGEALSAGVGQAPGAPQLQGDQAIERLRAALAAACWRPGYVPVLPEDDAAR